MSFRTPINCSTDSIGNLEKVFLDEMGTVFDSVITQVNALESQIASSGVQQDLAEGNSLLQDLISTGDQGSNIQYLEQLPDLFGIDTPNNQENDEKKVFDTTELVLTNGVFFKKADADSPSPSNIETLRRVFNSVGKDFEKMAAEYAKGADSSYRYRITSASLQPDLPNKSLTLSQIRMRLNDHTIVRADYVEMPDKSVLLVKKNPLLVPDLTDAEIQPRFGYSTEEISSSVIHKNVAKNTTSAINNWITQGFDVELPAILDGEDPALNFDVINPLFEEVKKLTGNLLNDLNFYVQRIDSLDLNLIRSRIQLQLDAIDVAIKNLVSVFLTEVSVITEFDTLTKLRSKLTDEEIRYLLLNQRYVIGIDLDATEDEVSNLILGTISQVAGDNTASTAYLNSSPSLRDENYAVILYMLADIQQALTINGSPLTAVTLRQMIDVITTLNGRKLVTEIPPKAPVAGYPCFDTPAAIALQRMNYNKNFKISLKIKALDDAIAKIKDLYNDTVGKLLTNLMKSLSNIVQRAIQMVNQLRDKLLAAVTPLKRQLNEFISKYLTLIGNGDFDSSVFKCAINYNIGLSTGILDALEALIIRLAEKINTLIAQLLGLILGAITGIICPVIAFIEKILGAGNDYLPSFCAINTPVLLPPEAVTALQEMRRIVLMQNVAFTEYNGDLVRVRATLTTAPDRLDVFRDGANCLGQTANAMVSTTLINVTKGVSVPGLPI
jgi:hypothetical protein